MIFFYIINSYFIVNIRGVNMNRIKYMLVLAIFSAIYADEGFFKDTWKTKSFVSPSLTTSMSLSTANSTTTIDVNVGTLVNKVYPSVFSNNFNGYMSKELLTDAFAQKQVSNANIYAARLPGGNWSNVWFWDGINHWDGSNQNGYSGGLKKSKSTDANTYLADIRGMPNETWTRSSDDMLDMAALVGAKPQICVNMALARYIDATDAVAQAAHYAAEWVRHVNVTRGLAVEYWEVGNENYGSWQAGYEVDDVLITAQEYGQVFNVYVDSMKAADPTIKIGAVVYGIGNGSDVANWDRDVLMEVKDHVDFLAVHEYFTWASDLNDVTEQQVLDGLPLIGEIKETLENAVEQYTGNSRGYYPIAMTEYNMRAGAKDKEYISAIFISMALGEYIKNGYGLVNIWDVSNGWDDNEGDHGMFSRNNPDVEDFTPHSNFYPYYYYTNYFGDVMVEAISNKKDVKVYASTFSSGQVSMVLVNQGSSKETVEINLNDFNMGSKLYMYTIQADELTAPKFEVNGQGSNTAFHGPINYDEIKPYKADILGNIKIDVDKYSINFIIVETAETTDAKVDGVLNNSLKLSLTPSAFNPKAVKYYLNNDGIVDVSLYSVSGSMIGLYSGKANAGENLVDLSNLNLASGVYVLKIKQGNSLLQRKIVID